MRLIYPGPADEVKILATGQVATRGKALDVTDVDVGLSLIAQGWTSAPKKKARAQQDAPAANPDTKDHTP